MLHSCTGCWCTPSAASSRRSRAARGALCGGAERQSLVFKRCLTTRAGAPSLVHQCGCTNAPGRASTPPGSAGRAPAQPHAASRHLSLPPPLLLSSCTHSQAQHARTRRLSMHAPAGSACTHPQAQLDARQLRPDAGRHFPADGCPAGQLLRVGCKRGPAVACVLAGLRLG